MDTDSAASPFTTRHATVTADLPLSRGGAVQRTPECDADTVSGVFVSRQCSSDWTHDRLWLSRSVKVVLVSPAEVLQ